MAEPKCPECGGVELEVKLITEKMPDSSALHITSLFYCLKCGKIISVNTMKS